MIESNISAEWSTEESKVQLIIEGVKNDKKKDCDRHLNQRIGLKRTSYDTSVIPGPSSMFMGTTAARTNSLGLALLLICQFTFWINATKLAHYFVLC